MAAGDGAVKGHSPMPHVSRERDQQRSLRTWLLLLCFVLLSVRHARCGTSPSDACCPAAGSPPNVEGIDKPKRMAFLVGAQKSGTSFLFNELVTRHPKIRPQREKPGKKKGGKIKETQYFSAPPPLDSFEEYVELFGNSGNLSSSLLTFFDATPSYMPIPSAACRIAAVFPDARLVAVLRDPVERALSQWNMRRVLRKGRPPKFDEEVKREIRRLRARNCSFEVPSSDDLPEVLANSSEGPWSRLPGLPSYNSCFRCLFRCGMYAENQESESQGKCEYDGGNMVRRGLYVYQLEWWLQHFPAEQLLVINHQEMVKDPEAVLDRVILFLGQDPALKRPAAGKSGFTLPKGNVRKVYSGAMKELYHFYAHPNAELYRLMASLGHSSGWTGKFPTMPSQ